MYIYSRLSASLTLVGFATNIIFPQYALSGFSSIYPGLAKDSNLEPMFSNSLPTIYGQALVQTANPDTPIVIGKRWVVVTAYSSTPDQTDATPFITASGTYVRDGIVACNFLRFGTRVRFPQLYGDKIFVVEDRMAAKNSHKMDIWFAERSDARQFGVKQLQIEVLEI